ncbi:MAG: exopolysaccharide biosynthesis polyprenyl glycosylphosphotransferase, partial [Opitutaceae bacterium]
SAALTANSADMLVATTLDLPRDQMARAIEICERSYVDLKVIPSAFDLFISHLQLESHGGVPVLGIGTLAIRRLFNRAAKRAVDIAGASIGLALGAPLLAIGALLLRRESPGNIIFRQTRVGARHATFTMYKLRTMRLGAESEDDARHSTAPDDPRMLRAGRWLRRWNIDEIPQFWNVLRGDMSLVGPRPERPYHVDSLARRMAHYLPRHLVKPGMTGWAQVNGCRGDGGLEQRLQLDIHYIERWSILLDLQIMLLTFLRWRAPA